MRLSPVAVVLFAIVFAVVAMPLIAALFTNAANALAAVPIPQAKTETDLGKARSKPCPTGYSHCSPTPSPSPSSWQSHLCCTPPSRP